VTRKITRAAAKILLGMQENLYMGNLDAQRDWGHARDYVEAMYLILQQSEPDDFVIATGVTTYVRDFIRMAFDRLGMELEFKGEGVNEIAVLAGVNRARLEELGVEDVSHLKTGTQLVGVDPRYFRPTEVELLIGDATKARQKLGWKPRHTLSDLVEDMIQSDLKIMQREKFLYEGGFNVLHQHE
jgi:GDPmannose 4,6-dehydratase